MRASASGIWADLPRMPGARDDCEKTRLRADDSLGKLSGARKLLAYLSRDWVRCFVLMLIGFIIHLPALPGGLIWDDEYLARDNPFIKSPLLLLETFRHYLFPDAFSTHYRPVQTISYLFDYAFWNNNSYGFHLSNVLWHLGSGVLLYFLLKRLLAPLRAALDSEGSRSQSGMIAFFVALLWVVHPVQSAAVDYISGRADSLAFFFACAAWLLFLRGARILHSLGRVACYSLSAFFLLLALCSRESALIWVALFLFHLFALEKRFGQRAKLCVLIACFGIVTLYAGLRHLPRDARTTIPASTTLASTRAVLMLRALGDYGRLMIFPANLHMERTVESDDAASVSVAGWRRSIATEYLSVAGLVVAAALAFGSARKGPGRPIRILGAGWFIIAYLPISNLIELNATVAEHWLYLPSVGFLLFLAGCCLDFPERFRRASVVAACFFAIALSVRSAMRSSDWSSPETFYRRTIAAGGTKTRVALNLAAIYSARGDYAKAESLTRKIVQMTPDYPIARNSLAHVLFLEGRTAEADALFVAASNSADAARKEYARTWVAALNVAHMRFNEHQPEKALEILAKARRDYPETWELISFQAEVLRTTRGPEAALAAVENFAQKNWWHYGAAIALGKLYFEKGDLPRAEAALRHASRLDVHDAKALDLLAAIKLNENRVAEACATQRRAVRRQPDEPRQYFMLADILTKMGRTAEARATLAQATRMEALAEHGSVAD